MGKKGSKAKSSKTKSDRSKLKQRAKDNAQKIWLAGLGALAAAESEGEKLFAGLVERGEEMEKRGKPVAEKLSKKAAKARKVAEEHATQVGNDAKEAWTKVESLLEEKVQTALQSRGYAGRDEVDALHKKIADLTAQLSSAKKATRRKPAKKTTAKKTTAKKTAARKPAKKTTARKPAKKTATKRVRKPAKNTTRPATDAS